MINCDLVSRKVTSDGSNCLNDLVLEFSDKILTPDGKLNRKQLGSIVFTDSQKLMRLNEIVFPYIIDKILAVAKYLIDMGFTVIVFDAPTLFESGLDKVCDVIISIVANEETRISRIISRDKLTHEEACARISSQYDDSFFRTQSDLLIENDGTKADLIRKLADASAYISRIVK